MRRATVAVMAGAALVLAGCGGADGVAESVIEDRIEDESGGDVDIDLDDGNFSVETEEGSIEFETDGDGNVSIEGVDSDGEEFSIESEDGVTRIESEDGDATMTQEDGETVIETDEGSMTINDGGTELPEGFPAEVPLPDGLVVALSQTFESESGPTFFVSGTAQGDQESYVDELVAALEAAGYAQQQVVESPQGSLVSYERDGVVVAVTIGTGATDGEITVAYQVIPS